MIGQKYQNEHIASLDIIRIAKQNNNARWLKQYIAQVIDSINGRILPI